MSAENELAVYKMANGEYWLCERRCGDTVMEAQGEIIEIIAKCASYEEIAAAFRRASGEGMDPVADPGAAIEAGYVFTEYGGHLPSQEDFDSQPAHFLKSVVTVEYPRECGCVDYRDLAKRRWRVVEFTWNSADGERILGEELEYAQALTLANWHAQWEPGECEVHAPRLFRQFDDYGHHDCTNDRPTLRLPEDEDS